MSDIESALEWLDTVPDELAHWGSYADEYHQAKWNLEGDVDRARKNAQTIRAHVAALVAERDALRGIVVARDLLEALRELCELYESDEGCRDLPQYRNAKAAIARAFALGGGGVMPLAPRWRQRGA